MQEAKANEIEKFYTILDKKQWEEKDYIPTMQEIVTEANYYSFSIDDEVVYLEQCSELTYYRPIVSKHFMGKVLIFVRKAIRKVMAFLIYPITYDQSSYNAHIATTMRKIEIEMEEQKETIQELTEIIDQLTEENRRLRENAIMNGHGGKKSESLSGN